MASCKPETPVSRSDSAPPLLSSKYDSSPRILITIGHAAILEKYLLSANRAPDFAIQARIPLKGFSLLAKGFLLVWLHAARLRGHGPFIVRTVRCVAWLHGRIMATIADRRSHNADVTHRYSRVSFPAERVAGSEGACSSSRWCQTGCLLLVHPFSFAVVGSFSLSLSLRLPFARKLLFLHAHRNICLRTISPVERSWKTNKQKGSRLRDSTDRHSSSWFNIELLSSRVSTRFLFSVSGSASDETKSRGLLAVALLRSGEIG